MSTPTLEDLIAWLKEVHIASTISHLHGIGITDQAADVGQWIATNLPLIAEAEEMSIFISNFLILDLNDPGFQFALKHAAQDIQNRIQGAAK